MAVATIPGYLADGILAELQDSEIDGLASLQLSADAIANAQRAA